MQRPVAALLIVIIGYFLSKIFAALINHLIPAKLYPRKRAGESVVPLRLSVAKFCFWLAWFIFIVIALIQVHPSLFTLSNLSNNSVDYFQLFATVLCACILILFEKHILHFIEILGSLIKVSFLSKNAFVIKAIRFIWIPILVVFIFTWALPETIYNKIAMTLFILFAGWLSSNILKQIIMSFAEVFGFRDQFWSKYFRYLFFAHFIIAAINVWK